jgi:hypothetical protein
MADKDCQKCLHQMNGICQKTLFRCNYERRYTDSDFCGPSARWFEARDTKADSDGGGA